MLDIYEIRKLFPGLERKIGSKPMVYLDNTATSQTPSCVVDEIVKGYYNRKANVHRGVSSISIEATDAQERCRKSVQRWINAESEEEIIFTRGTTEAINLVASSFGERFNEGDEVILTVMEHHSNIVPWQLLRERKKINLKVVPLNPDKSTLNIDFYKDLFSDKTAMVAITHVSNVLGTVNPVKEIIDIAHRNGVPVLVDGAQAAPHLPVDVRDLDADFYAFSAHKMYGPCGIGILYGKQKWLESMPPYQGGGEMISHVTFEHTVWADLPFKFEAGTPDFIGIAALRTALNFIEEVGLENIRTHEEHLLSIATEELKKIERLRIFGEAKDKSGVISFLLGDAHHYDTGVLLDGQGIVVRTGHHCAQPLMQALDIEGTVRASFAVYNTENEIYRFVECLNKVSKILG